MKRQTPQKSQSSRSKNETPPSPNPKSTSQVKTSTLSPQGTKTRTPAKEPHYPLHLNPEECTSYLSGKFYVVSSKRKMGYVNCAGISVHICIENELVRNRAVHGDEVAIQVNPIDLWVPITKLTDHQISSTPEMNPVEMELWQPKLSLLQNFNVETKISSSVHEIDILSRENNLQPTAEIVCILNKKRQTQQVGGLVVQSPLQPGQPLPSNVSYVSFNPTDPRYPNLLVFRNDLPDAFRSNPLDYQNHLFLVDIAEDWPETSKMARGVNVRPLGEMGDISVETLALIKQNGVDHPDFSEEALAELQTFLGPTDEKIEWQIPEEEIQTRRDLRSTRIFTVDPPTAKDLDDALHVTPLPDGNFEIGVHIADVSYFLREGSVLDGEAQQRATSVYLVQKVIPMLPSILCEELCSLNPNVDRLAFSCIWKMKADGTLLDERPWFGRTVIRSCAKLDYPTAQNMIDGLIPSTPSSGSNPDSFLADISEDIWETKRRPIGQAAWECARDVCLMHSIAMNRRRARFENGAISLNQTKVSFKLDHLGNPREAQPYLIRESNQMIEEYMLLANYLVAEELILKLDCAAFIRAHRPPDRTQLIESQTAFQARGLDLRVETSGDLQQSLNGLARTLDPISLRAVNSIIMTAMKRAEYMVVSDSPSVSWRHYALNIPYYTHFTSPIRRYPDVVVHRLLDQVLRPDNALALRSLQSEESVERMQLVASHCNEMKKAAQESQQRSDLIFLATYLKDSPVEVEGVVIGVGPKSFSVLDSRFGTTARLFVDDMEGFECEFSEETMILHIRRSTPETQPLTRSNPSRSLRGQCIRSDRMSLSIMTRVVVRLMPTQAPPLDVLMMLVGPLDVIRPSGSPENEQSFIDDLSSLNI